MTVKNRSFATLYVVLVMFLPNTFYLLNHPSIPLVSVKRLYIIAWLVVYFSIFISSTANRKHLYNFPLLKGFLYLSSSLFIVMVSTVSHHPLSLPTYISFIVEILFPVLMIWTAFRKSEDLLKVIKLMVWIYVFIALYGIIAYLSDYNPLLNYLNPGNDIRDLMNTYEGNVRGGIEGRAQSFLSHPLHLGYLSAAIMVIIFGTQQAFRIFNIKVYALLMFILMMSIIVAGSRSPIFMLFVTAVLYVIHTNLITLVKFTLIAVLSLVIVVIGGTIFESVLGNYAFLVTSIYSDFATGDSGFGGSSMDMRMVQLLSAMDYFWERPLVGHGLAFIRILLVDGPIPGLLGAESFLFQLLIEVGIVGMIGYYFFYQNIYFGFIHYRFSGLSFQVRRIAIVGIALLAGHLAFIFATGDMGMTSIYLIFTVLLLRLAYLIQAEQERSITCVQNTTV